MNQEMFMRFVTSLVFGFASAWVVFSRNNTEMGDKCASGERQRYLPYISGGLLASFLLATGILAAFFYGAASAAQLTLAICFGIFLHISAYYILLLLILPILRKYISARACAMLWVVPNYLYITSAGYMTLPEPKLVIHAPGNAAWVLFYVWLSGFVGVLLWKTIEHLMFRHSVLQESCAVSDPDTIAVRDKVIAEARIKKPHFQLIRSSHVKTPLSVGLFQRTIKVILPQQDYSPEELDLILRHEIIHIARQDSWSKFFLVFCTAMCWFNPLMWMAMKKSAEDIELCCDETVLLDANAQTRKQYASLLLDAAGDERGFTTCLSASAKAMRYRLKGITKPARRRSGAIIVGLVFFLLCMTSGYVALAYSDQRGAELIYKNRDYNEYRCLRYSSLAGNKFDRDYEIIDKDAFHTYLSSLTLSELTGNYSFHSSGTKSECIMEAPEGTLVVILYDNAIQITTLHGKNPKTKYYYIRDGIDWEYINSIILAHPTLDIHFTGEDVPYGTDASALLTMLWKTADGQKQLVYDHPEYPEGETNGMFGYTPYDEAALSFSEELAAPCRVQIESWDRSKSYTVSQEGLSEPFAFGLPSYRAHYTIYASFYDQYRNLYDAEFRFDIGDIEP